MKSRMKPQYYLSDSIFQKEKEQIFKKMWLFAGLKFFLKKNNSFITRKIFGIPIVIQNFNGSIKAFENTCLHRNAPLQTTFTGCRPLICPYHAWKYDVSGKVNNIPHCEKFYGFSDFEKSNLKLKEFQIKIIGNLIFIHLSPSPPPIEEQFSEKFIISLENSSSHYDTEVMMTTWHCNFNWKLAYENLRDPNHVAYVHPKSLAPYLDLFSEVDHVAAENSLHNLEETSPQALLREIKKYSYGGFPEGKLERISSFEWQKNVDRWHASLLTDTNIESDDAYFNWLAFPNLHIASGDGGYTFTIEYHIPVAPGKTDVEIYYMTARKKKRYASSTQVLMSAMQAGKKILKEDYDILEQIQQSLHEDTPVAKQGTYESTNRMIERWYAALMEDEHASL